MNKNLHALVMAGGSGTRFWPRSRASKPKQFLSLTSEKSLIEETLDRVKSLCPRENQWVLTRGDLKAGVQERVSWMNPDRIIAEPEGRDTAPCLVYGGARVEAIDPDATLLVLPADHVIDDPEYFCKNVQGAIDSLQEVDGLLTFGIKPSFPATGYGYIQRKDEEGIEAGPARCYGVESFREKPDLETAKSYMEAGSYFWNAGIFLWKLSTFRAALKSCTPELEAGWSALSDLGSELAAEDSPELAKRFGQLEKISIDYALLERASNVRMVQADFPWDDVGSWKALEKYQDRDADDNAEEGQTLLLDTKKCTVLGADKRVVAVLGVEGLAVIDTPDALLVCPRDRVEEVKSLVDGIKAKGWDEVL